MFIGTDHSGVDRGMIGDQGHGRNTFLSAKVLRRVAGFEGLAPGLELLTIGTGVDHIPASADGQKFEARRETFKTRYSSKYFGTQKGVSAMTLIANHAAINARVIGANEHESHYIFDLLMSNTSEIIPDVLSTDTHGVNHVNFALLDLFGYQFAPRYAQVGKVINEMFDVKEDEENRIQLRLKKPINTHRIAQHWDTIQRIAVSLKQRKTTQSTLVRKLSGYKHNHPLLEALTEYNRLAKANYLLCYICLLY